MDVPQLIDHILETHHQPLHEGMPALSAAMDADPPSPECRAAWEALRALIEGHLMKEEHMLFPTARALAAGEAPQITGFEGPLAQMGVEHQQLEELCDELASTLDGAGAHREALQAVIDDLVVHAGLEDGELFPRIEALAAANAEAEAEREAEARAAVAERMRVMEAERPKKLGKRARIKRALGKVFGD